MAKYVKLCTNPQHSVKGPQGTLCPACWAQRGRTTDPQWLEDAKTEYDVLLRRIQEAFFEGFAESDTGDFSVLEAWRRSNAKRVHDTLKQLWSKQ